ncbi:hypothetical protein [Actinoplanes sp. NPDC049316]|uniref:hypothetical protein n=1 Tax=Actinoplanes sp. NPDC049316 TaxID=3154727 RepID=UPI003442811D
MTLSHRQSPEIVVGLVATPPDHPAQVVARLAAELGDRLAERVDAGVRWTVRDGWGRWRRGVTGARRDCWTISPVGVLTTGGTSRSA